MSFLPSYYYFILASFLASLTVYSWHYPKLYLRLFPFFLLLTLIIEALGSYASEHGRNNMYLYNYFSTFEFLFYMWMISNIISSKRIRYLMWITMAVYAIITVLNILLIVKKTELHVTTYAAGCLLVVMFCIYYFLELFRRPKSVVLSRTPEFWICSGLLFFYCCGFPLYALITFWGDLVIANFVFIITILNSFLYSLFAIAFLCRINSRKYTLSL